MEIAKELLIGIQLPSKTGPLVPTHRKMKRVNKSYSGLVGKPQKVRQGRKLFSACISPCPSALPPLFFLATEAGNRMVYPQPPPWTWGGGAGHFRVDPVPACKFYQSNWSRKAWAKDVPYNHTRNPNTGILSQSCSFSKSSCDSHHLCESISWPMQFPVSFSCLNCNSKSLPPFPL